MVVRSGVHSAMGNSALMPEGCQVCRLPFCTMFVAACLLALLQLPSLLRWLRTHAVSGGGFSWWGSPCGSLVCHKVHCTERSFVIMCRMPLPSPLVQIGLPRLSSMSGHWACQRLLLMMAHFSLTCPVFVVTLPAKIMRSGKACMLPQARTLQRGQVVHVSSLVFAHWSRAGAVLSAASE